MDTPESWRFDFFVPFEKAQGLQSFLQEVDPLGEEPLSFSYEALGWDQPRTTAVLFSIFYPQKLEWAEEIKRLNALLVPLFEGELKEAIENAQISYIPPTDWVLKTQENLPPIQAGRFFLYGSHYTGKIPADKTTLKIDASLAFGTGQHETTQGCLLALDHLLEKGTPKRILDVGTGSGVLGIAASKETNVPSFGIDLDKTSVEVALENAQINAVGTLFSAVQGVGYAPVQTKDLYDLIFANILAGPLIELAPQASKALVVEGRLILAGFLLSQEKAVLQAHEKESFLLEERLVFGEWVILSLKKRSL